MSKVKDFNSYLRDSEILPGINNGQEFEIDGVDASSLASSLVGFMMDQGMSFDPMPTIEFVEDEQKEEHPFFRRTGYYNLLDNGIRIFVSGRALKDIIRSLAHELIHVDQHLNLGWDLTPAAKGLGEDGDEAGDKIEGDAYKRGNLMFRKFEDHHRPKWK